MQPQVITMVEDLFCKEVPNLVSSFVETFVDFTVSGLFLLPDQNPSSVPLRTRYPNASRLVAIGDLHGDLEKTKQAFKLASLVDASDRWVGGSTTVVQIGDVLDRGGEELKILYYIEKLKREASRCGGEIISMNGNHEIMNVEGDFRFITKQGLQEFKTWADWYRIGNKMKLLCQGCENPKDNHKNLFEGIPYTFRGVSEEFSEGFRARIAALRPSGPISTRFLARNVTILVVGDSVFVHGGLLPEHVSYGLERINHEVRDWIFNGKGSSSPSYCRGRNAVVWLRSFSEESPVKCDCSTLEHVLATIPGAKRMVMGHTIQQLGINGVCEDRAIRIDVGMSRGCINGIPEVLEIVRKSDSESDVRILTANMFYNYKPSATKKRGEGLGLMMPEIGPKEVQVKA